MVTVPPFRVQLDTTGTLELLGVALDEEGIAELELGTTITYDELLDGNASELLLGVGQT